jgi:hypothetical protein
MFYGEQLCQTTYLSGKNKGKECSNFAYYEKNNKYLCGVHSKNPRNKLPINPKKNEIELKKEIDEKHFCEETAKKNIKNGVTGDITVSKLKMMKKPENIKGYTKVFPNFKHQNRKDGIGCSSLSPKALGPIDHNIPGLPPSKNLENFHQFSKFFPFEIKNNKILQEAFELRIKGFNDNVPHRHKFDIKTLKKYGDNVNIPLFSMFYDKSGNEHRYSYIECRYFYCHWYEKLAKETKEFQYLKYLIKMGNNLQIIGYDGYKPNKDLIIHYEDDKQPFGHELVLYTMLKIDNPEHYPWNIYYKKHKNIYNNVI